MEMTIVDTKKTMIIVGGSAFTRVLSLSSFVVAGEVVAVVNDVNEVVAVFDAVVGVVLLADSVVFLVLLETVSLT